MKFICLIIFYSVFLPWNTLYALPAFPGAEGFGSNTRGAYGGSGTPQIIHVTNLNDSGPGSFRAAIDSSGPRIVVFDVGGVIQLYSGISRWNTAYLTIAGQTAPGDGIVIKGGRLEFRHSHDIIIRGLKIRPDNGGEGAPCVDRSGIVLKGKDDDHNWPTRDVIIDHCSFAWTTDKIITLWFKTQNITVQNCILAEPLRDGCWSGQNHNYAFLVGPGADHISIHHNIFSQSSYRNPLFGGGGDDGTNALLPGATQCESINNIVYNGRWGSLRIAKNSTYSGPQPQQIVVVSEYHKAGPDDTMQYSFIANRDNVDASSKLYIHDNINPIRTTNSQDDWAVFNSSEPTQTAARVTNWPFSRSGITVSNAHDNYNHLLGMDGNIPRVGAYPRDTTDSRIINDIRNGSGSWIDSSSDVGGYPAYSSGVGPTDTDRDGMPDSWETDHGLNPNNGSDAHQDRTGDGYTNLEEYINGIFGSSGSFPQPEPGTIPGVWLLLKSL